jgi:hypothetical protein
MLLIAIGIICFLAGLAAFMPLLGLWAAWCERGVKRTSS